MENNIVKNFESLNISLDTAKNIPINKTNEEDMTCTDSDCVKSINLKANSLQCNSYERYVHYRCTNMPAYLIEYFVKKEKEIDLQHVHSRFKRDRRGRKRC